MSVLLINPRNPVHGASWPPLGLLYLAAALESAGFDVEVHDDCLGDELNPSRRPRLIGITCTTPNFMAVKELVATCRRRWPGVPIILGGPHISAIPEDGVSLGASSVCIGDGEEAILQAAADARKGVLLRWKYYSDSYRVDANRWPIPARKYVPIERYTAKQDGLLTGSIITSKGCPYDCRFCCHTPGYRKVSIRDMSNVARELQELRTRYSSLMVFADEINLDNQHVLEFCRAIEPMGFKWCCHVRASSFNKTQAEAMAGAGCREIRVGVENGSAEILKTVHKGCTPEDNTRARRIAKEYGIRFCAFIMLGLPGETPETVEQSRRWLIENRPDYYSVFTFQPFPGTPIYDHPECYDIRFPRPLPYGQMNLNIRGEKDQQAPCIVSTSAMSSEQISDAVRYFDTELRQEIS